MSHFGTQETREWLGVSSLFGNPILVNLLVRLNMRDELDGILDSVAKQEFGTESLRQSTIAGIGEAYGELNMLDEAQAYYDALKSPADRAHFAAGVLVGLATSR